MEPYLKGPKVLVTDTAEASTLQNKGSFGRPVRGGELHLDLLEAVYLTENDRIKVTEGRRGGSMGWIDLLKKGLSEPGHFLGRYMVYRDLRNRGLVVRIGGEGGFLIYPRGTKGLNAKPSGWVHIHSENDKVTLAALDKKVRENDGMRISTLSAIFDSDWDVTFYNIRTPGITSREREVGSKPLAVEEDIDLFPLDGSGALATRRSGTPFGTDRTFGSCVKDILLLSKEESHYIDEKAGKIVDGDDLRWTTYRDLTDKGFRVRSGLKYGCHYRVYTSPDPSDHSTHLIQCMDPKKKLSWEELARAIRLCHSVRKRMIYAYPGEGEGISYLEMEWTRP